MILYPQNNNSKFELLVGNANLATVYNIYTLDFKDVFAIPSISDYKDIGIYFDGIFTIKEENWANLLYGLIDIPYLYDRSGKLVIFNNEFLSHRDIFNPGNFTDIRRSFSKYVNTYFPEEDTKLIEEFFES